MGCFMFLLLLLLIVVGGAAYLQLSGTFDVMWEIFAVDIY